MRFVTSAGISWMHSLSIALQEMKALYAPFLLAARRAEDYPRLGSTKRGHNHLCTSVPYY